MDQNIEWRDDLIPEIIERDHIRPFLEAAVAFVTALTGITQSVKSLEMRRDKDGRLRIPVKLTADFGTKEMDYVVVEMPLVIPLPRGTLFKRASKDEEDSEYS